MTTATIDLDNITLTTDQQAALDGILQFILDPIESVFVLRGYSGCGKSTLVRTLLDRLPGFMKMAKLVNPSQKEWEVALTATTNKAAEALSLLTGGEVTTIHSFLGLRVETNFRTNTTTLIPRNTEQKENYLLLIDEASYVDSQLLGLVFSGTKNCKIVFIGDPAQLTPVKSSTTPVFDANFSGAELTQVVRQAEGNPIVDLSTKFRHAVNTGEFFSFKPDGRHIQHMSRDDFNAAIVAEFTRPDWRYLDSKILAWTNKCVIGYNQFVRNLAKGDPHFQVDDYAICNSFIQVGKVAFKTDQMVQITAIDPETAVLGVRGNWVEIDGRCKAFQPKSRDEKNARIKQARANNDIHDVVRMESQWIDLRAAYASTINKAQGSTYGSVYIDLDDVSRCNSSEQIARMLYVGVSRAKYRVYLTGDIA